MAAVDFLVSDAPQSVYLFPTPTGALDFANPPGQDSNRTPLYFQYWPQSLTDDYQVEYAEHAIPGGSHPLYQWVGGRGRTLSFESVFTSELNLKRGGTFGLLGGLDGGSSAANIANSVANSLVPSTIYTVDVAAALARLRSWMMPKYGAGGRLGETDPPKILTLVFPNTKLGGKGGALSDSVTVILRSAPITYEAWFPDGSPRVATVALTFNEIVQTPSGSGQNSSTKVEFIGRDAFETGGQNYRNPGLPNRPWFGG
jgi:hypothetical protein